MRGTAAYLDDFYFGASAQSTSQQQTIGSDGVADPTANTPAAGGGGVTMSGQLAGNPATSPAAKLQPTPFWPALKANPLWFIPIGLGAIVILKIVREGGRKSTEFAPLKADAYWFGMTVLAAVTGIPLVKAIASKYAPQPVRDYVNNA